MIKVPVNSFYKQRMAHNLIIKIVKSTNLFLLDTLKTKEEKLAEREKYRKEKLKEECDLCSKKI